MHFTVLDNTHLMPTATRVRDVYHKTRKSGGYPAREIGLFLPVAAPSLHNLKIQLAGAIQQSV
ncbi:MAG: hypothetical protein RR075_04740, partial [Pygmaiobacter sp.]